MKDQGSKAEPFYGWYVVGALFFATFAAIGVRQAFGVFVETWEQEFGVSVSTVSIAAGVGWLMNGLAQPLLGRLTDRYGGRPVVIGSLAVMGAATLAVSLSSDVVMLVVFYGVAISFASGGVSPAITGAIVAKWFQRRRGMAMSFLISGGSAGGLILVPFLAYLMAATSWRTAWVVAGAIMLLLGVPLLVAIVRSDPREMALELDGTQAERGNRAPALTTSVAPLQAAHWNDPFKSAPIWQLSLAYFVCGITTASIAAHYVRWASSEGIPPTTAALAFGVLSGINAIGVLMVGPVSDRIQRKTLLGAVYLVRAVGFLALIFLRGPAALWGFAIIGGASWLATVPLTTALTADVYGVRHIGILIGLITLMHQLGGGLAVYLFGLAFDVFGSYRIPFAAGAILLAVAGGLSLSIRERTYSVRYVAATGIP